MQQSIASSFFIHLSFQYFVLHSNKKIELVIHKNKSILLTL